MIIHSFNMAMELAGKAVLGYRGRMHGPGVT